MKKDDNTSYQNLTAEAVLKGEFTAISAYMKKLDRYQINELSMHLKDIEKQQVKSKIRRKKLKLENTEIKK